ncbi:MAG TPA: hypothetical protein VF526_11620, partial [Solirubrobacteraceae bacterium]
MAALLILGAAAPGVFLASADNLLAPQTLVLGACAFASVLNASRWDGATQVSAAFVCWMLAVAFVSPVGAFAVAFAAELGTWTVQRYRLVALPVNLASSATPALLAGLAFFALTGGVMNNADANEIVALALVGVGFLALNFVLLRTLAVLLDGGRLGKALRPPRELVPSLALTMALTLAISGVYARYGEPAGLFVVLVIVTFTYMSRLVVIARQRTGQYASLSWGVLSALVRSLDRRDGRTARHSAAVAAFARD